MSDDRAVWAITWRWKNRAGQPHETTQECVDGRPWEPGVYEQTRLRAIKAGYPGHQGGWYGYFVDDLHAWLRRRFGPPCACHICGRWSAAPRA
jgi:hypothetical protein